MAGRIGWSSKPERGWVVSSWVFRQLLEDVISQYPEDLDIASEFKTAARAKYLYLDNFRPDVTNKLTEAIRETASAIASGRIETMLSIKPYGTPEIVVEYRRALQKLLSLVGSGPDFAP